MRRMILVLLILGVAPLRAAPWIAAPEVVAGTDPAARTVGGTVFEDRNGDGRLDSGERGVPGVLVSNGLDVVKTGRDGRYTLPVRADMNLAIVQPSGWEVPVDRRMVPQFHHVHKAAGSPAALRFGGLPAAGAPPRTVNFPLRRAAAAERFGCAIIGDSQTYSNTEIGYFRDSTVADILNAPAGRFRCMLYLGDVVGDDLGLLDRLLEVGAAAGLPQWLTHGNHDFDFDATDDADSADSWRRIWGPEYHAFEIGRVLFVVLDNVVYPCTAEDRAAGRTQCGNPDRPAYTGRVTDRQMRWLEAILRETPKDRLIVFASHIPFVSTVDAASRQHQTANLAAIHKLVAGRPALSLSGHTHTTENLAPGDYFRGWEEAVGVTRLPFRHIVAGAASGGWYQGDFDHFGTPMALQRMGEPKGFLTLDFDGNRYRERYFGARLDPDRRFWASLNTPGFRRWYDAITAWAREPVASRDPLPPFSAHDLEDGRILTPRDLAEGVHLAVNVWDGDRETRVTAAINDGPALPATRTQAGDGEPMRTGAEWADPLAAARQLSVARVAMASRSGIERNQGIEVFRGSRRGPAAPQPGTVINDRNMHLWRLTLPRDLPPGVHRLEVVATDRHGVATRERLAVEVRGERPPPRARTELWGSR